MNITSPDRPEYRHSAGYSEAHLTSLMRWSSCTGIIIGGKLLLGIWQGIYFAEYDGPRSREVIVMIMEG